MNNISKISDKINFNVEIYEVLKHSNFKNKIRVAE